MVDLAATRACAESLDAEDHLAPMRHEFAIPNRADGSDEIYFVGNSLGAQPKRARDYVEAEMRQWAGIGVRGHFTGDTKWATYHRLLAETMADVVGARPDEVVVMNALTVNLHLLLVSFYEPTPERHKILIEEHAFPSDHFAVESQIRQRGYDPATSLVIVKPRPGEDTLHPEDILATIAEHGPELATILLPGIQYYTGQVLPMAEITAAGHRVGARVGFDLAHAAGNIPLDLHDWNVDFAAWCTYKYLNAGPGSPGGAFVHERHVADQALPKLLGWWGNDPATRFAMDTVFEPALTVDSWQLSNAGILSMAPLRAALEIVAEAGGMDVLRAKTELQVQYFDLLLADRFVGRVANLTPTELDARGCQFSLSIIADVDGRAVFEALEAAGVACDWRYPNVIRVAPTPLYNSFTEIWEFCEELDRILADAGAPT